MKKLLSYIIAAILGLWLVPLFVPGIAIQVQSQSNFFGYPIASIWELFLMLGIFLGLLNMVGGKLLQTFSLPLEVLVFPIASVALGMAFLWGLDYIFDELYIPLWLPLLYTALSTIALQVILEKVLIKED